MIDTLWGLGIACGVFFGVHLIPSGMPGLRARLIEVLPGRAYQGLFSLLSLSGLVWMSMARNGAPYLELWWAPDWTRLIPVVVLPVAFVLLILTYASRDGVRAITRHPMLWSVLLWAVAHLPANGDAGSIMLFGGFALFALIDMPLADARLRREDPGRWQTIAAETSLVPFAAVAAGRARLSLAALGWWKIALGLVIYVLILFAHEHIFGLDVVP
jgi:uncharacterized membrane protein